MRWRPSASAPAAIVGLNLAQCPETVITHIASAKLGAIVLPLAVLFGPDALRYRLTDSGAKVLITTQEGYERCAAILREAPALRHTIIVGDSPAQTAAASAISGLCSSAARPSAGRPTRRPKIPR